MLPHIVTRSREEGLVAASNLIALGKTGGTLSVGPFRTYSDGSGVFRIPETPKDAIDLAVKITKPWLGKDS